MQIDGESAIIVIIYVKRLYGNTSNSRRLRSLFGEKKFLGKPNTHRLHIRSCTQARRAGTHARMHAQGYRAAEPSIIVVFASAAIFLAAPKTHTHTRGCERAAIQRDRRGSLYTAVLWYIRRKNTYPRPSPRCYSVQPPSHLIRRLLPVRVYACRNVLWIIYYVCCMFTIRHL